MPVMQTRCCCGEQPCQAGGYRYAEIEPQMLKEKYLNHSLSDFSVPGSVSFWVRYEIKSCDEPNVIVEQETRVVESISEGGEITYQTRQILEGDFGTLFMTDLGPSVFPGGGVRPPGTPGTMTLPGTNEARVHTYYGTNSFDSFSVDYGGNMASSVLGVREDAFRHYNRNCFKLKQTTAGENELPYLTENEWLARGDHRIVFLNVGTHPDLVEEDGDVAQFDVHIFAGNKFIETDCVPGVYSPLLHLLPEGIVAGFYYGEDRAFITYDYKDYYPNQVGLNVPEGAVGQGVKSVTSQCDTITANPGSPFPAIQFIAYAYEIENSTGYEFLPFKTRQRYACPEQAYRIDMGALTQNFFVPSNGISCFDNSFEDYCASVEFCHGLKPMPTYACYAHFGSDNAVQAGGRSVFSDNPLRNRMFVQGLRSSSSLEVVVVSASQPGKDDFEGFEFLTFTGSNAVRIFNSGQLIGSLNFGNQIQPNQEPIPPTDTNCSLNGEVHQNIQNLFTEECFCSDPGCSFVNYGKVDGWFGIFWNGSKWAKRTPGYQFVGSNGAPGFDTSNIGDNNGEDRILGETQFIFP